MKKNPTIGITGGSGYIGSSLASRLSKSFNIILMDIKPPSKQFANNVTFQECDVRDYDAVHKVVENVDLVIHTSIIQIPAINDQKKLAYEVNVLGTQNICKATSESKRAKGLILSGSWHTIGEKGLQGLINEEFGFRPDKVEDRARLYALSKMAQESIVRFYAEMTGKIFGIIRMGTVLGEGMPEKTAANIFIENGLNGKPLTPFKNSMYRPMLYVDIDDICRAYEIFAEKIIGNSLSLSGNSMSNIFNVYHDQPVSIIDLALITKEAITNQTHHKIKPQINIIDNGQPSTFNEDDKNRITVDTSKAVQFFGLTKFKSPKESIEALVKARLTLQS